MGWGFWKGGDRDGGGGNDLYGREKEHIMILRAWVGEVTGWIAFGGGEMHMAYAYEIVMV